MPDSARRRGGTTAGPSNGARRRCGTAAGPSDGARRRGGTAAGPSDGARRRGGTAAAVRVVGSSLSLVARAALVALVALGGVLAGCVALTQAGQSSAFEASVASDTAADAAARDELVLHDDGARNVFLLGEVHDNATQHALRLRAFGDLLASGARPALLMEQLDRDRQADIDRARAGRPAPDAAAIVGAAGGMPGWDRLLYEPFIELALVHDVPIVAANVSRTEARKVMAGGLAAAGFEARVPPDIEAAHVAEIVASHCGRVDRPTAARMALAQSARDQQMARLLARHAARGVVLLAGNEHVRKDVGVYRWLPPDLQARTLAIGLLEGEAGQIPATAFDRVLFTPSPANRPDPCAATRG